MLRILLYGLTCVLLCLGTMLFVFGLPLALVLGGGALAERVTRSRQAPEGAAELAFALGAMGASGVFCALLLGPSWLRDRLAARHRRRAEEAVSRIPGGAGVSGTETRQPSRRVSTLHEWGTRLLSLMLFGIACAGGAAVAAWAARDAGVPQEAHGFLAVAGGALTALNIGFAACALPRLAAHLRGRREKAAKREETER